MTMAVAQGDPGEEKYELIVKSYFADRLQRKGFNVPGYNNTTVNNQYDQTNNNQHEIALTLRRVGDELEARNSEFFENMCNQLNITPDTAYSTFRTIADEIFSSETNWGRVVAFLTFGSTLAIHCASRNDMGFQYVDRVAGWVAKYMLNQLDNWIQQNGNWDGFLEFFERPNLARNDNGNQNGFIMSALAGLGIGALIMMTFK